MANSNTSAEYISRVLYASPAANNDAGIPQMCDLILALKNERDELKVTIADLYNDIDGLYKDIDSLYRDLAEGRN